MMIEPLLDRCGTGFASNFILQSAAAGTADCTDNLATFDSFIYPQAVFQRQW